MAFPLLPFSRATPTTIIRKGQSAPIILDTLSKENFTGSADPTAHPVEDGADISDHIVIKPKSLSISGIITATPLGDPSAIVRSAGFAAGTVIGSRHPLGKFGRGAGVAGEIAGGFAGKSIAASVFGSKDRNLGDIAKELIEMRDARETVTIITGLRKYENYALASFAVSRDDKTGQMIKVDLDFKEIITVSSRTTTIAIPKVVGAIKKKDVGHQSTTDLPKDKEEKGASLLKHAGRALKSAFTGGGGPG
jgi:hypothetical protein